MWWVVGMEGMIWGRGWKRGLAGYGDVAYTLNNISSIQTPSHHHEQGNQSFPRKTPHTPFPSAPSPFLQKTAPQFTRFMFFGSHSSFPPPPLSPCGDSRKEPFALLSKTWGLFISHDNRTQAGLVSNRRLCARPRVGRDISSRADTRSPRSAEGPRG